MWPVSQLECSALLERTVLLECLLELAVPVAIHVLLVLHLKPHALHPPTPTTLDMALELHLHVHGFVVMATISTALCAPLVPVTPGV